MMCDNCLSMLAKIRGASDETGAIVGEPKLPLEVAEYDGNRYYVQKPCGGENCNAYPKRWQGELFK